MITPSQPIVTAIPIRRPIPSFNKNHAATAVKVGYVNWMTVAEAKGNVEIKGNINQTGNQQVEGEIVASTEVTASGVTLTSSEHFQDLLGQDNWEEHVDEMRRLVSGDHGIKLTCSYILDKLHHFIETGSGGE